MSEQELFILTVAIGAAVILARVLASRLEIPEAILLVVLGVLASAIPAVPTIHLPPNVVLLLFLPPLVYNAAFLSAPRETRENVVPIATLAVGATLVTTFAVAAVTRTLVGGIGWAAALALGAAVAPTDAVSATAILQRVGAPRRIVTILEGESLLNDGVALTVFGLAVEALTTPFTIDHGAQRLVLVVLGGVAFGLVAGWIIGRVRRGVRDPGIQLLISLLTPFLTYIPAEELHFSGVLATVTAAVYLSNRTEGLLQPASRLTGAMFWRTLIFLLSSTLFVLLGLELRATVTELAGEHPTAGLVVSALAVTGVAISVRLVWEFVVPPLRRLIPGKHGEYVHVSWRRRLILGWGGMRGAISLAIALSLPTTLRGTPFDARNTLIFLAASVVVITLIGQGLTLAPLLRALGLAEGEAQVVREARARRVVIEAALARLDQLTEQEQVEEDVAQTYRQLLELRLDRVRALLEDEDVERGDLPDTRRLRRELVQAQRARLDRLYRSGKIDYGIYRSIGHELDLQEPRSR